VQQELEEILATLAGDENKEPMGGGEVAGRIEDLPMVGELIEKITKEAEEIIRTLPERFTK